MPFTNVGSLTGAEDEAFNYLRVALGGVEGEDCFKGWMPAAHEAWFFAINGGPDPTYADCVTAEAGIVSRPWPSWITNAELGGWFVERTDAQALIEFLLDALPAGLNHGDTGGNMECIQTLRLDSFPTLDLVTKEFKGSEFYVWELTATFQCVLNAQTTP